MLRLLGIILGFIIMVLSVIGLLTVDEPVLESPDDLYGPAEAIGWGPEVPDSGMPELIAGVGSGDMEYPVPSITAGDGPDVLEETQPQIIPAAGSIGSSAQDPELPVLSAGVAALVNNYDGAATITFGDGYTMQIPKGLIMSDEGTSKDHEITGYSQGQGPAFSIRCLIPDQPLTMEDLKDICLDLYGEANQVTGEDLTYLTAYDADTDSQMCIFPSAYSSQVYIIGMTGLDEGMTAQQYFATLTSSPLFF